MLFIQGLASPPTRVLFFPPPCHPLKPSLDGELAPLPPPPPLCPSPWPPT